MNEPSTDLDRVAHDVIGAAIEVHRHLGPGFLESVYEEALGVELDLRGIPFQRQVTTTIRYKGHEIGESRLDLLVGGALVVELKTVESIQPVHVAQLMSYLRARRLRLGLLLNFHVVTLRQGIRRVIWSNSDPEG